jgi:P4 family phage/plasmid primase-like protien
MTFLHEASNYLAMGLSPIPIRPKTKIPWMDKWSKYCKRRPTEEEIQAWDQMSPDLNIGLAMGIPLNENEIFGALDIDDDDQVEAVIRALGCRRPAKKGSKGLTIFVRAPKDMRSRKLKRDKKDVPKGDPNKPVVEILLGGNQTVVPPSVHPDGNNYHWVDAPMSQHDVINLPLLSDEVVDELYALVKGQCPHFKAMNEMTWVGVGGGGDTHDTCLAAVAALVARDWSDEAIQDRIQRAKREAVEAGGETYHWPEAERTIQEWIDSAREKGMTGVAVGQDSEGPKVPAERRMATWGIEAMGGPMEIGTVNGQLRKHQAGHWPKVDLTNLMFDMYQVNPFINEANVKSAVNIMHVLLKKPNFGETPGTKPENDPKKQRICLLNGTINTKDQTLEPHSLNHELMYQLNFEWDNDATCPLYEKFALETFDGDQKALDCFEEFAGLTLVDDMSYQKMLFLKGPGSNGKGTLAGVLKSMHDPEAIGSVGITDLNDERKRSSLVGKLVNVSGEQSRLNKVSDTYLKKITGGDAIDVRALYKELQNNVLLSVRFIELVNEMPSSTDTSYAFRRRLIILDCPNIIAGEALDRQLGDKLLLERPGILKRWVIALKRLRDRGKFDPPESSERQVDEYMEGGDPIRLWLEERTRPLNDGEKGEAGSTLYENYVEWSKLNGYTFRFNSRNWGKRLTEMGIPSKQVWVHKSNYRSRDIKLHDPGTY